MEFYQQDIKSCLYNLKSSLSGLSSAEVSTRIDAAKNLSIEKSKKSSFLSKFLTQIKELMVLVLLISGVVSIVIGVTENSSSEIIDGVIILGIVIMNALFGVYQERKSEKAIESLKNMTKPQTKVLRDGKVCKIKTSELVYGDIVCLDAGSIVPADLRLLESVNLKINESSLTGESEAVEKHCDITYEKTIPLADRKNVAFQGSVVENGHGKGLVYGIGKESELGKIAQSIKETKKELTPLQKSIQGVGRVLTYIILLMATVTFILETIANPSQILQAFLTAVAISVAAIPESMPAVITIIMSMGISKLSKQKAIIKHMYAVETLGACDVICSDKTGTITQNKMKVQKYFTFFKENSSNFDIFLKNMVLCNDAQRGAKDFVGGSTEVALLNFAQKHKVDIEKERLKNPRIDEISFSSQRKMMTTFNSVSGKRICFSKGALDRILQRCDKVLTENGAVELDDNMKQSILFENKKMCEDALRVISFAYLPCEKMEEKGLVFVGLCGIQDPPRKEILDAVKKCKKAGMRAVMITGDYKDTAFAIAKQVGIATDESEVLSGEQIDELGDEEFKKVVEHVCVFARVSPAHKVRIVQTLKENGHIVAMTGDGVNDAPSLKKADIGIGMGKTGTDVTKETADVLITDDNFATIIVAVEEGRKIYSNIQKTIKYLFSANMAEILSLFFITIFLPGRTFLLPVQILFVNLITDSLPAIALGMESVESDVMTLPPRKKGAGLFSDGMGVSLLVLGVVQTLLTLGAYLIGLFLVGQQTAITMAFYTLNLIQLFYMFTARTKGSCFKSNPFKNTFFNISLGVGLGLILLMIVTPLGEILKLAKLDGFCWAIVLVFSISIIFIGELYKFVERKLKKASK